MAVAPIDEVSVPLLRPLTTEEHDYAAKLLDWAETLIKRRYPNLDGLDIPSVILVETQAAARVLNNPRGEYQESVGGGEYSKTRDKVGADGILRITDEEWDLLNPDTETATGGAFSVDTVPTTAGMHSPICSLYFGATYCSCGSELTGYQFPIYEGC